MQGAVPTITKPWPCAAEFGPRTLPMLHANQQCCSSAHRQCTSAPHGTPAVRRQCTPALTAAPQSRANCGMGHMGGCCAGAAPTA